MNPTILFDCVDVYKRQASAFGSVALGIPYRLGHAQLATELCDSSVDCHSSHDRDLSLIHIYY